VHYDQPLVVESIEAAHRAGNAGGCRCGNLRRGRFFVKSSFHFSEAGAIAHLTTRGAYTSVKQYPYPRFGPAIASAGLRIRVKDTGEIYFAGHQSRVAKYLNGSWTPIPAGNEDEKAEEIFGTPTSLFLVTSN